MKKGVVSVLSLLTGIVAGAGTIIKMTGEKMDKTKGESDKYKELFLMMNQWVNVKQEGKNLSAYFEKNGYRKIAVYGLSYTGETLLDELEGTGVEVLYAIDQRADFLNLDIEVFSPDDTLEQVDAIVVTPITFFSAIEEKLRDKVDCPILSLMNIVDEV